MFTQNDVIFPKLETSKIPRIQLRPKLLYFYDKISIISKKQELEFYTKNSPPHFNSKKEASFFEQNFQNSFIEKSLLNTQLNIIQKQSQEKKSEFNSIHMTSRRQAILTDRDMHAIDSIKNIESKIGFFKKQRKAYFHTLSPNKEIQQEEEEQQDTQIYPPLQLLIPQKRFNFPKKPYRKRIENNEMLVKKLLDQEQSDVDDSNKSNDLIYSLTHPKDKRTQISFHFQYKNIKFLILVKCMVIKLVGQQIQYKELCISVTQFLLSLGIECLQQVLLKCIEVYNGKIQLNWNNFNWRKAEYKLSDQPNEIAFLIKDKFHGFVQKIHFQMPSIEYIAVEEELAISEPLTTLNLMEILQFSEQIQKIKQRFCGREIFKQLYKKVKNLTVNTEVISDESVSQKSLHNAFRSQESIPFSEKSDSDENPINELSIRSEQDEEVQDIFVIDGKENSVSSGQNNQITQQLFLEDSIREESYTNDKINENLFVNEDTIEEYHKNEDRLSQQEEKILFEKQIVEPLLDNKNGNQEINDSPKMKKVEIDIDIQSQNNNTYEFPGRGHRGSLQFQSMYEIPVPQDVKLKVKTSEELPGSLQKISKVIQNTLQIEQRKQSDFEQFSSINQVDQLKVEQKEKESHLQQFFRSSEDSIQSREEKQIKIAQILQEKNLVILKYFENTNHFRLFLCYDKNNQTYQIWKKYRPKYSRFAFLERKIVDKIQKYKSYNKFQFKAKNQSELNKKIITQDIQSMLADQIEIMITLPILQDAYNLNIDELLIFQGVSCNLQEYAIGRSNQIKDPFTSQEVAYIFWFLVYSIYQLAKIQIFHNNINPSNIVLIKTSNEQEYELRLINFLQIQKITKSYSPIQKELNTHLEQLELIEKIYSQLACVFNTIMIIFGYNKFQIKQTKQRNEARETEEDSNYNMWIDYEQFEKDKQILKQVLEQTTLNSIKNELWRIFTVDEEFRIVESLQSNYIRNFICTQKKINDSTETAKHLELQLWRDYFKMCGKSQFDKQLLIDLGLQDIQKKVIIHFNEKQQLQKEQKNQEKLQLILQPYIQNQTQKQFEVQFNLLIKKIFQDDLISAQSKMNIEKQIQSYLNQAKIFMGMGEIENSIKTLEFALKFLPELMGQKFFQKAIEIYERLSQQYFLIDNFEKSSEYILKATQLLEKEQSKQNEHLKNSLFLLHCRIIEKKGQRENAIQELYNVIFKLEQKQEKEQNKTAKKNILIEKKKRQLQLAKFYDCLAEMYWRKKLYKLAQNYEKRSLIVKKEILPKIHPDIAYTQRFLYKILAARDKNFEKQEEYYEKSQKTIQSIRAFFYISINEQEKLKEQINISLKNVNELKRKKQLFWYVNHSRSQDKESSDKEPIDKDLSFDPLYRKSCIYASFEFVKLICGEESTEFQEETLRMSQICYELGQLKEVSFYLNKLHILLVSHIDENSTLLKPLYYELCQLQFELQNYTESLKLNSKLLSLFQNKLSLDYSEALGQRVAILSNMNQIDQAVKIKEISQQIRTRILGQNHPTVISGQELIKTLKQLKK